MNMEKMRWFIVGNLIGFALLFGGIALNDRLKHDDSNADKSNESSNPNDQPAKTDANSEPVPPPSVEEGYDKETRLVTTRDISKGTVLQPSDVELRQVRLKHGKPDGFIEVDTALGRKTRIDLVEGEMLQPVDLEKK